MKNPTTILLISAILVIILMSLKTPETKPVLKQTVSVICNTPELVKIYIDVYSKQGYYVKEITSQSVSTSMNFSDYNYKASRELYGKFILVMEK